MDDVRRLHSRHLWMSWVRVQSKRVVVRQPFPVQVRGKKIMNETMWLVCAYNFSLPAAAAEEMQAGASAQP